MRTSWTSHDTTKWAAIDWMSVLVDFSWSITSTIVHPVEDLDLSIRAIDALSPEQLVTALGENDGKVLVGSVARPEGISPDELMARLLYLHPLAKASFRDVTIRALVTARGIDEEGWQFSRYFPKGQIVPGWGIRRVARSVEDGLRRGAIEAHIELSNVSPEHRLEGVVRLLEVMCETFMHGPAEPALIYGLAKRISKLVGMSIPLDIAVDDNARVEFVRNMWARLYDWRDHLSDLTLMLPRICSTPASASAAVDALSDSAEHWTIKRALFELCANARRPDDMKKFVQTSHGAMALQSKLDRPLDEQSEIAKVCAETRVSETIAA